MRHRSFAAVVIAAIFLTRATGCTQHIQQGSDVDKLQSVQIEKNKTTEKQLVEMLGPPATTTTQGDGSRILVWNGMAADVTPNSAQYIPIAGIFFAGHNGSGTTKSRSLTATVRNGTVIDYTITDSADNVNY